MNSRRKFMLMSAAAAAATFMPVVNASAKDARLPSNVIHTKGDPGIWAKKSGSHLPQVERKGDEVIISTLHPMTEEHYIVRHTFVDEDGKVIGAKTFANTDKKAVSKFRLPAGSNGKTFYATSFCNKHDYWMSKVRL